MRSRLGFVGLLVLFTLHPDPAAAVCPDAFTEGWDEACCGFPTADFINVQISLPVGGGLLDRFFLEDFDPDLTLPVSNEGDRELYWTNGFLDAGDLALTVDSYDECRVRMETVFAANGDIAGAQPRAGVVVRFQGIGQGFYSAYAHIHDDGGFKLQLRLEKYLGFFMPLDLGPPPSEAFDFEINQNYRVGIEVSEPDAIGRSQLTGYLERVTVVDGALHYETLVIVTGVDDDFRGGQIGLYVEAGSVVTQVAFDESIAFLPGPPTPVRGSTWGALKTIYR